MSRVLFIVTESFESLYIYRGWGIFITCNQGETWDAFDTSWHYDIRDIEGNCPDNAFNAAYCLEACLKAAKSEVDFWEDYLNEDEW